MWQSALGYIVKTVLEWIAFHVKKWINRKKEQTERHGENNAKVEDYKKADAAAVRDTFEKLP